MLVVCLTKINVQKTQRILETNCQENNLSLFKEWAVELNREFQKEEMQMNINPFQNIQHL